MISAVVGFKGSIVTDLSRPDGTPRKLLDVSRLKDLGWKPQYDLKRGLTETYSWYLNTVIGNNTVQEPDQSPAR